LCSDAGRRLRWLDDCLCCCHATEWGACAVDAAAVSSYTNTSSFPLLAAKKAKSCDCGSP